VNVHPKFDPSCPSMSGVSDRDIETIDLNKNSGHKGYNPVSRKDMTPNFQDSMTTFSVSREEFELLLQAVKSVTPQHEWKGIGRKPYNRAILHAVVFLAIQQGWSVRQAAEWCENNLELLREHGWNEKKAPSKSILHEVVKNMRVSDLLRISAKLKALKGGIPVLWF